MTGGVLGQGREINGRTPPLTEGMVRKGGRNAETSRVEERPPGPAPFKPSEEVSESVETVASNARFIVELPLAFGNKVHIDGDDSIKGTVTGFNIAPHGVQVEVGWFANGDSKSAWFAIWRLSDTT